MKTVIWQDCKKNKAGLLARVSVHLLHSLAVRMAETS